MGNAGWRNTHTFQYSKPFEHLAQCRLAQHPHLSAPQIPAHISIHILQAYKPNWHRKQQASAATTVHHCFGSAKRCKHLLINQQFRHMSFTSIQISSSLAEAMMQQAHTNPTASTAW
jgi:hypothetical protein